EADGLGDGRALAQDPRHEEAAQPTFSVIAGANLRVGDGEPARVDAAGERAGRAEAPHAQYPSATPLGIGVAEHALQIAVRAAEIAVLDDDGTVFSARGGPRSAGVRKRGLLSQVGDNVAVEA